MRTDVLKVAGMSCGHCEMSAQEALGGLEEVESARADHGSGRVEVRYDEGRVGPGRLREAVERAGYALDG